MYVGTAYHGSQIQNNAVTVQSEFQAALLRVLGYLPAIKCCSRTDSGVHAKQFFISFYAAAPLNCEKLVMALNANLPRDIRVHAVKEVPADFHARYSAIGKHYEYYLLNKTYHTAFSWRNAYVCNYSIVG